MPQSPVKKRFDVALDMYRASSGRAFTVVEGDNGNEIHITLSNAGTPVQLSSCFIQAVFSRSDGTTASQHSDGGGITIAGSNEIIIDLYTSSFCPGIVECELQVFSGSDQSTLVTTAKFNFDCRHAILNEKTIAAAPEHPLLIKMLQEMNEATQAALQAAENLEALIDGNIITWEILCY